MKWLLISLVLTVVQVAWMSPMPDTTITATEPNGNLTLDQSGMNNGICRLLSSNDSVEIVLRATLLFTDKLILITENWMVAEISTASMAHSFGMLLLANVSTTVIEEKWPAFRQNPKFTQFKDDIFNILSLDIENQIVVFNIKNQSSLEFNIQSGVLSDSESSFDYHQPMASVTSPTELYTVSIEFNEVLSLQQWHLVSNYKHKVKLIANSIEKLYLYYILDSSKKVVFVSKNTPEFYSKYRDIAKKQLKPINQWGVPPGFIFNGYFHFFLLNDVYVFSAHVNQKGNIWFIESLLYKFSYKDYFVCQDTFIIPLPYPSIVPQPVTNILKYNVTEIIPTQTQQVVINNNQHPNGYYQKYFMYASALIILVVLIAMLWFVYANMSNKQTKLMMTSKEDTGANRSSPSKTRKSSKHPKSPKNSSSKKTTSHSESRSSCRSSRKQKQAQQYRIKSEPKLSNSRENSKIKSSLSEGKSVVNPNIESLKIASSSSTISSCSNQILSKSSMVQSKNSSQLPSIWSKSSVASSSSSSSSSNSANLEQQ